MKQKILPSTSLRVSSLGLGLAALGRPGYINLGHWQDLHGQYSEEAMEERAHELLDAAWAAGVRYFDAARSYGKAEQFLASWLKKRQVPEADVVVGSKWGYTYTAGWKVKAQTHEVKKHTLEQLQKQWEESHRLLGGWIKLYQIHSATLESGVLENKEVLEELWRMKKGGLAIGLSLSGTRQAETLKKALQISRQGELLFNSVQATWNLLEPSAELMLQQAHARGMGVIVKEVLANGRLSERNPEPEFTNKYKVLKQLAAKKGCTAEAMATAVAMARPWADIVLSGASTEAQLETGLLAAKTAEEIGEKEMEAVGVIAEETADYWHKRSALEWN